MPDPQRPTVVRSPSHDTIERNAAPSPDPWLDDQVNFWWYIDAIRLHRLLVCAGALLGAAVGWATTVGSQTTYEAAATVLVAPSPRAPNGPVTPAIFTALLQSGSLATQVVSELGLDKPPASLTPQALLDRVVVEPVTGTNLIRVRVALGDPVQAAQASSRLASKAIVQAKQLSDDQASSLEDQLKSRGTEASTRLDRAQQELLKYKQQAQVELLTGDAEAMVEGRRDLVKLTVDIESEKARLSAAEEELKRQPPVLSIPRATDAEAALGRLPPDAGGIQPPGENTGPDARTLNLANPFVNPVYQTLQLQIATARAQLAALEQQRHQLADVNKVGGAELDKLSELYRRELNLAKLQAAVDLATRVYNDVASRYEQARTDAMTEHPQLELVDAATPPDRPVPRGRMRASAVGLAAGLFASALAALFLEARRDQIQRSRPSPA